MPVGERQAAGFVRHFPADESSVPAARHFASAIARDRMSADQIRALALAITEVVANAVRHSGSEEDVKVAITPLDSHLCVRVTDAGGGLVPRPGAIGGEDGAGFGLFIVERLTRRWGMTREHGATRVWFELDYTASQDGADAAAA